MAVDVDVQIASRSNRVPPRTTLAAWVRLAAQRHDAHGEVSLRVVDRAEGEALNEQYRGVLGKTGPTNVLAFTFGPEPMRPDPAVPGAIPPPWMPSPMPDPILGDIVVCAPVVTREAREQGKSVEDHWAHLVIHGTLHLLGFDHQTAAEARVMESREREILLQLGIDDPYREEGT